MKYQEVDLNVLPCRAESSLLCGFPLCPSQAHVAALWGHLVVQEAPLVWVLLAGFRETAPLPAQPAQNILTVG